MLRKLMFFAVVFTLSSVALAQIKTRQEARTEQSSKVADPAPECAATFTSGTDLTLTQFCVTGAGNIAQFSVDGVEMIADEQIGEGYGICDETPQARYYDYYYVDSGNWRSTKQITVNGNVVTITRTTSDGLWQLKQVITNIPATALGPGSVKISMALKNLSGVSKNVILMRWADVDANSDASGNDFDFTNQTSYGLEPISGFGLGSTNNTFNAREQGAFALNTFEGPDPCATWGGFLPASLFHGDGSIGQSWQFSIAPHASSTAISTYKPI